MPEEEDEDHVDQPDWRRAAGLLKRLDEALPTAPIAECLTLALSLARELGDKTLAQWAILELLGYDRDNPAMAADIVVPSYRVVAGTWIDAYQRPLLITQPEMQFVNELPLHTGVAELETLAAARKTLVLPEPELAKALEDNMHVKVTAFTFGHYTAKAVLSAIKAQLSFRLDPVRQRVRQGYGEIAPPGPLASEPPRRSLAARILTLAIGLVVFLAALTGILTYFHVDILSVFGNH